MIFWQHLLDKLQGNQKVYILTVIENQGSSPGRKGFKMLVAQDGFIFGSVGGGVMEFALVEEAQRKMDVGSAEKLANKLKKGKGFDLEDYRDQVAQMNNMGGLESMMGKLPGMSNLNLPTGAVGGMMGDMNKSVAVINSMTAKERQFPALIKGSRKKRIAKGSGTEIQDVNKTLKQFTQMQKMMKKMKGKGGMQKMMRGMKGMLPPGMMGGGGPKF